MIYMFILYSIHKKCLLDYHFYTHTTNTFLLLQKAYLFDISWDQYKELI